MRRLPIFFLLDVSESMAGENIQKMEEGIGLIVSSLRKDPHALESVYLSIIAFAGVARTIVPLVDVVSFYPPKLPLGSGTSLGAALRELMKQIDTSVIQTTTEQKGDWKPIAYLFTDGKPTDNLDRAIFDWKKTYTKKTNLIAVALGKYADIVALRDITDTLLVFEETQEKDFTKFFQWVSASVIAQSKSAGASQQGGDIDLGKLDNKILKLVKKETPISYSIHDDRDCVVLVGRCQKNRNAYLIKYDRLKNVAALKTINAKNFELTGCYPITEEYFEWSTTEAADLKVNTSELIGCPGCPYCGNPTAFAMCECGKLMCLSGPGLATCPWCEKKTEFCAGDGSKAFDVQRGRG